MKKHRLSRILASISALAMTTCGVPFTTSAETLSKADYNVITDTDISLAMQTSIPRMLWTMKNKPDYEWVFVGPIGGYMKQLRKPEGLYEIK